MNTFPNAVEVLDLNYENPIHRKGLLEILDSYASDPMGGGEALQPDVRERLIPGLRDHPTSKILLACEAQRPIGIAVCFFNFSTFRARPLLNIHDLAVLPEWRGKGIGRALLTAAEIRALEKGCCKLTLEVRQDNGRARSLYDSFGFSDFVVGDSEATYFLSKNLKGDSGT